jgi:hypothetical protein
VPHVGKLVVKGLTQVRLYNKTHEVSLPRKKNDCDLVGMALDIQHGWCRPTNPEDFYMGPHVVDLLNPTPILKWYMLRLVVKNLH